MTRPNLAELAAVCQKLGHRELGTWLARRVSRPLALRITWLLLPWPISANLATLLAWSCAIGAAAALASGTVGGWLLGAVLLHAWYLGDHVDGQLARWRQTESLDGVQLDYLMHHTIDWLIPLAVAAGLGRGGQSHAWWWAGVLWGGATLVLGLEHDARTKAFEQRLKRVLGELRAIGGGGGRPTRAAPPRWAAGALCKWLARKNCETHVVMNVLSLLALAAWWAGDQQLIWARGYAAAMAFIAPAVAVGVLVRSQREGRVEGSFKQWYQPPPGCDIVYLDGWWQVLEPLPQSAQSSGAPGDDCLDR